MIWGALAQSAPDIDFLAALWLSPAENLLAHRGFTHSLLFIAIITPLFALSAMRLHRPHNIALKKWLFFFGTQGLIHIGLDGFNAYGVGWLEPFNHHRFSFNVLFVADPLFSIWPAIALAALIILRTGNKQRVLWWVSGLMATAAYMIYAVSNKIYIDRAVDKALKQDHIITEHVLTTPTPFNNWLWYIVAPAKKGYYIGYRSVFDTQPGIDFHFVSRNDSLLRGVADHESLQHLLKFSQGYYTVSYDNDTLLFNDLRFGQILGWKYPDQKFTFHYYLQHPADNKFVVQRGRFEKWNAQEIKDFLIRIKGY